MSDRFADCVDISPECPVEASIYGYYPNLGATIFFLVYFGIIAFIHIGQGVLWKTWTFSISMCVGCLLQSAGYIGRIMLHSNPWDNPGFSLQICCLTFAPVFNAAAIYLMLKHMVLNVDPSISRIQPKWYPRIFLTGDFCALVLQGAGGGIAATAKVGSNMLQVGTNMMIAGLVFQVVTLIFFAITTLDYFWRLKKSGGHVKTRDSSTVNRFHLFLPALGFAYITLLVRCVYRIPELSGGWKNPLMQNQIEFIILDSTMIGLSTLAITIFPPGYFFPQMAGRHRNARVDAEPSLRTDKNNSSLVDLSDLSSRQPSVSPAC